MKNEEETFCENKRYSKAWSVIKKIFLITNLLLMLKAIISFQTLAALIGVIVSFGCLESPNSSLCQQSSLEYIFIIVFVPFVLLLWINSILFCIQGLKQFELGKLKTICIVLSFILVSIFLTSTTYRKFLYRSENKCKQTVF